MRARDHPRSRGVYTAYEDDPEKKPGIIPARAGFTDHNDMVMKIDSDHPRSRGVYLPLGHSPGNAEGSSPLARGLLHSSTR